MEKQLFITWFIKLKAFYIIGLLLTGVWLGSKWFGGEPRWDWEPAAASALLLAGIIGAEKAEHDREQAARDPDLEMRRLNPDIRRLMRFLNTFPRDQIQPAHVQELVVIIASTIARIHFDREELPLPKSSNRIFSEGEKFDCDACHSKQVDVYPTGHCPRCKFESHSWMQLKSRL